MADHLDWEGPAADPLLLLVTEQDYSVPYFEQWLLRMLDVPAALAARGYPKGVSGEVHLAVLDDMLPANDGPVILSVANGRGRGSAGR